MKRQSQSRTQSLSKTKNKVIKSKDIINDPLATATKKSFKDITNPEYVGPGAWVTLHKQSFLAREKPEQNEFIKYMTNLCYTFPCLHCRVHCSDYISKNPINDYKNIEVEIQGMLLSLGMFIWTWKFHNAVNLRLGKPIMSWDTAYNLYSETDSIVCSTPCTKA